MKKRAGEPWMTPAAYGGTLEGLSLNLIVRDVAKSLAFYVEVLGFTALYSDPDFAALERERVRLQLHADHTYEKMPWAPLLAGATPRGLGAEIRILGVEPEPVERAARERGHTVLVPTRQRGHGWREVIVADPDGYAFAVGVPTAEP